MILRVTSLPSLPCQYQKIIESDQPTYQKYHKIALKIGIFFINLAGNFKRVRLLGWGVYYNKYCMSSLFAQSVV